MTHHPSKVFGKVKVWLMSRIKAEVKFAVIWATLFASLLLVFYGLSLAPRNIIYIGDKAINLLAGSNYSSSYLPPTQVTAARKLTDTAEAKIIIPDISLSAPVLMPESIDLDVLNSALTKGVVHYPGSALPDEKGNVLLFGHSTSFTVVRNKAYAVFNNLSKLEAGNIVRLEYGNREYWYKVQTAKIKKADEALVDLAPNKRMLTLSTCNVFGSKDDRLVVTAEFMRSYPLREFASAADSSS